MSSKFSLHLHSDYTCPECSGLGRPARTVIADGRRTITAECRSCGCRWDIVREDPAW